MTSRSHVLSAEAASQCMRRRPVLIGARRGRCADLDGSSPASSRRLSGGVVDGSRAVRPSPEYERARRREPPQAPATGLRSWVKSSSGPRFAVGRPPPQDGLRTGCRGPCRPENASPSRRCGTDIIGRHDADVEPLIGARSNRSSGPATNPSWTPLPYTPPPLMARVGRKIRNQARSRGWRPSGRLARRRCREVP